MLIKDKNNYQVYPIEITKYLQIIRSQAAKKQMRARMSTTTPTVTNILGEDDTAYLCHSSMGDSLSILPIINLGIIYFLALSEWLACSKAAVAFRPALFCRTMGPPGCSEVQSVRSQTLSPMTTQMSLSLLCFPTSLQVQTLPSLLSIDFVDIQLLEYYLLHHPSTNYIYSIYIFYVLFLPTQLPFKFSIHNLKLVIIFLIFKLMSSSSSICNITLDDADLKKLQELDPNQSDGFRTFCKLSIPILIIYTNELSQKIQDVQMLNVQILVRQLRSATGNNQPDLQAMQIYLTSQTDLHFNFVSHCNQQTFQSIKTKNGLNIKFNDLPNILANLLTNSGRNNQNQVVVNLTYEGTGKMQIMQKTEYKNLELLQLFFNRSSIQKAHQSIIFRFNYQKSKLAMLQSSINSIYQILARKNPPLLQFIQANVGINE